MGDDSDRESWGPVPNSGGELWASDAGEIATLNPAGGFDILPQRMDQYGELYVRFQGKGRKTKVARIVASMVLHAFGKSRFGGHAIAYRDGATENCRLENLLWQRKGQPRVGDMKPRKCLGHHCGNATFMSSGDGNRLCSTCSRLNNLKGDAEGIHVPGEMPDAPSLAPPMSKRG